VDEHVRVDVDGVGRHLLERVEVVLPSLCPPHVLAIQVGLRGEHHGRRRPVGGPVAVRLGSP
jgi:hypothetical protein